eukprot:m.449059 g.449059  ORF g.449059 m.449059 type:complete len:291 (-) comp56897_c0_seq3:399-1271(-)
MIRGSTAFLHSWEGSVCIFASWLPPSSSGFVSLTRCSQHCFCCLPPPSLVHLQVHASTLGATSSEPGEDSTESHLSVLELQLLADPRLCDRVASSLLEEIVACESTLSEFTTQVPTLWKWLESVLDAHEKPSGLSRCHDDFTWITDPAQFTPQFQHRIDCLRAERHALLLAYEAAGTATALPAAALWKQIVRRQPRVAALPRVLDLADTVADSVEPPKPVMVPVSSEFEPDQPRLQFRPNSARAPAVDRALERLQALLTERLAEVALQSERIAAMREALADRFPRVVVLP